VSGPSTPTGSEHFRPGNYLNADDVCLLITEYSAPYSAVQIANEHDRIVRGLVKQLDALRAASSAQSKALTLIIEMDGDQPARSDWDMVRIARAALKETV